MYPNPDPNPDPNRNVNTSPVIVAPESNSSYHRPAALSELLSVVREKFSSAFDFGAIYLGRPPKSRIFKPPPPVPLSDFVRIFKTTPLPGRSEF